MSQTSLVESLPDRLNLVRSKITSKAKSLGLLEEPTLIVVTKNHPAQLVLDLMALGERNFGENRDQEASAKGTELAEHFAETDSTWHFIGQLQTNKVKSVLGYANFIHTVDRDSLVKELAKRSTDMGERSIKVFIEVNLTTIDGRGGVMPDQLMALADVVSSVPSLNLVGLMGVANPEMDPRIEFERLADIRANFLATYSDSSLFSLGMSGDYLEAMEFGATHLRIGSAITGQRNYQT
jgi:pyridoxal phosphate enzyme (YggS family)